MPGTIPFSCWKCRRRIKATLFDETWRCDHCGCGGEFTAFVMCNRFRAWWGKNPYVRPVLRGDWGWVVVDTKGAMTGFHRYTFRARLRLLIGLKGRLNSGEYVFKYVKFRGRLYRFLNWALGSQFPLRTYNSRRIILQPCSSAPKKV